LAIICFTALLLVVRISCPSTNRCSRCVVSTASKHTYISLNSGCIRKLRDIVIYIKRNIYTLKYRIHAVLSTQLI